jgi:superfamily II DNA or RNA helicase
MYEVCAMNRRTLMKHQRFMKRKGRSLGYKILLAAAPGTGKTMPSIQLILEHEPPYLVICRRDDYLTWRLELEAEGVDLNTVHFVQSGQDLFYDGHRSIWTVLTWDLFRNDNVSSWVKSIPFTIVAGDEIHTIKRWEAQRTKSSIRATRHIPHRIGMTGTPITNELKDVFSQCLFIDDGATFGDNEWKFLNKYYLQDKQHTSKGEQIGHGKWFLKRKSKEEIKAKLESVSFAVHEDEVLKLPPPKHVMKSAPMSGMQRRLYDMVVDEWELELLADNRIIELNQVVTKLQKLKQIASGFVYDDEHNARHLRCPKLDMLYDMLKDEDYFGNTPKLVIACAHSAEIERIAGMLVNMGRHPVTYYGEVSAKQRDENKHAFATDPLVTDFVSQADRLTGMNELICADTLVYFSNSLKVVSRQQGMRRVRRKGSEIHKRIYYYDLITEGTVEVAQVKNIGKKISLANYIVHGLKQGEPLRKLIAS